MNGTPSPGDKIAAKVNLSVYEDSECKKMVPPLYPGPGGLRKSTQYPASKKEGETVGTYTGNSSSVAYQINYVLDYFVAEQKVIGWRNRNIKRNVIVWVKKDEVTGFWDTGVDAPKVDDDPPPGNGNTTMLIGFGVAAAAVFKLFKQNNSK